MSDLIAEGNKITKLCLGEMEGGEERREGRGGRWNVWIYTSGQEDSFGKNEEGGPAWHWLVCMNGCLNLVEYLKCYNGLVRFPRGIEDIIHRTFELWVLNTLGMDIVRV